MKAVILAAGQGTRLRPITNEKPKCMIELAGHSLLEYQLSTMKEVGIQDITIVSGYRADRIPANAGRLLENPDFHCTNMVTTLFCARDLFDGKSDVIIIYGDIVTEKEIFSRLLECDAPICLPVDRAWRTLWSARMEDPLADAETLKIDHTGQITELGKKPNSYADIEAQYIGMFKINARDCPRFLAMYDGMDRSAQYDGKDFANMYMTSFLQHLIDNSWSIRAVPFDGGWLEIDTLDDLRLYEHMLETGTLESFCRLPL